jgi:hypothetical protein
MGRSNCCGLGSGAIGAPKLSIRRGTESVGMFSGGRVEIGGRPTAVGKGALAPQPDCTFHPGLGARSTTRGEFDGGRESSPQGLEMPTGGANVAGAPSATREEHLASPPHGFGGSGVATPPMGGNGWGAPVGGSGWLSPPGGLRCHWIPG